MSNYALSDYSVPCLTMLCLTVLCLTGPCLLGDSGGVVTVLLLTFARHRLSPLAAFTSGAYFLHSGRQ